MDLGKLGKFIAKMRKTKDLTQEKLAEMLSVHSKTISKWERGISAPDISLLIPLSEIFGISVNELLNYKVKDVSSTGTLGAIKYYTNSSKIRYIKWFLCVLIVLCIIFSSVLYAIKYNQLNLYKINTINDNYAIQGYVAYNHDKKIIFIDKIDFIDKYVGTDKETYIKNINFELYAGNKIIYTTGYNNFVKDESKSISEVLGNINFYVDANKENDITYKDMKKLVLNIEYTTSKDEHINFDIKLDLLESN